MKKHPLILIAGLLALPELTAQTTAARQDPYVAATNTGTAAAPAAPRNLSLRFEDFSLDLATAAELQRAGLGDAELYERLVAMAGKKEARQESLTVIRARSGEKAIAESILETIYATEFEPPELPNTVGVSISPPVTAADGTAPTATPDTAKLAGAVPASQLADLRTPGSPTSFETRNTGRTVEVEPTADQTGSIIDLRFSLDHVVLVGTSKHGQGLSLLEMPEFESQRTNSAATVSAGKPFLIGTVNRPPNSKVDADAANRIWFAFVTASFAKP